MKRFCTVPMPESLKEHALIHKEDALLYKYICGRPAGYKVGGWYVCEDHKKDYTDPNNWTATPLEGEIDDETNES